MSSYSEAKRLAKMCVDDEGNPPASYAPELAQYIGLAQVCATLAVVDELRRMNEDRDQFNTAMLEFFERLSERSSEVPSGDGATAQVVEKEGP